MSHRERITQPRPAPIGEKDCERKSKLIDEILARYEAVEQENGGRPEPIDDQEASDV